MPRKYGAAARWSLRSNAAGEARGSAFTSKVGGPPLSGLFVHAVAVIRTVPPPPARRHRPSIVGAVGRDLRSTFGNGAGAKASDSAARSSVTVIWRMG